MTNSTGYYGLDPIGPKDPNSIFPFDVDNASTEIFLNSMVKLVADKGVAASTAGDISIGVAVGFLDPDGMPQPHYWHGGSSAQAAWKCMVNIKRDQVYKVKCTTAYAASDVGLCTDIVIGTGDSVSGISGDYVVTLSTIAASLMVIGLVEDGNNAWGANQDLLVVINENAFLAAGPAGI